MASVAANAHAQAQVSAPPGKYFLEGEVTMEIGGMPSIVGRPGGVGHVPFRKHHRAIAGAAGAKILVVRVHSKGQPWRFAVKEAAKD